MQTKNIEDYSDEQIKEIVDKVVIELYDRRHRFWNYAKKNIPKHHWDDLYATIVEALYKNSKATAKAYLKNQHTFLATRVLLNQWASTTSPYYKNFRLKDNNETAVLNATDEIDDRVEKEEMEIKSHLVHEALQHLPLSFYEDQLIRMYYIERTHVSKIAKLHNISTNTVYANIVKVTDKLKQGIMHYLTTNRWDSEYQEIHYDNVVIPREKHNRTIIWMTADNEIRAEFKNIHEAAQHTGKKIGYLYTKLAPKAPKQTFKDGSYLVYGKRKGEL